MIPVIDMQRYRSFSEESRRAFNRWLWLEGLDVGEMFIFSVELHEGWILVGHHPYTLGWNGVILYGLRAGNGGRVEEAWFCHPVRTLPPEEFFRVE